MEMIRHTITNRFKRIFVLCGLIAALVVPASRVFAQSTPTPVDIIVQDLGQQKTLVGNMRNFRLMWFVPKGPDDKLRTLRVTGKLEVLFSDNVLREAAINVATPGEGPPATDVVIPVPFGVTPGFFRAKLTVNLSVTGKVNVTREFTAPGQPSGAPGVGDPGTNPPTIAIAEGILIKPCETGADCVDVKWAAARGKNRINNFHVTTQVTYQSNGLVSRRGGGQVTRSVERVLDANTRQARLSYTAPEPDFRATRIKVLIAAEYTSPELSKTGEKQGTLAGTFGGSSN